MRKNFYIVLSLLALLLIVAGIASGTTQAKAQAEVMPFNLSAGTISQMRIENENKLVVPDGKLEEVWQYMLERLVTDKTFIKSLDPAFDSYWYDEFFEDTYYDTPDLIMANHESGIRYRVRQNMTNPDSVKNGRELLQVKLNGIDAENKLNRGEIKFSINHPIKLNDVDDFLPVLGLLKNKDRPQFKDVMSDLGVDPYTLRPILVLNQRRRSIYITRNGGPFISIRLDEDTSNLLWSRWKRVEIEPELNEIPYTAAGLKEKAYMEGINAAIFNDLMRKFPEIQQDLTPKYNKALSYHVSQIPQLRWLIEKNIVQ